MKKLTAAEIDDAISGYLSFCAAVYDVLPKRVMIMTESIRANEALLERLKAKRK